MRLIRASLISLSSLLVTLTSVVIPEASPAQTAFSPEAFSSEIGSLTADFYCTNDDITLETALEQGMMSAAVESGLSISELEQKFDFSSDTYTKLMTITMFDDLIDNCPQRAKLLFRELFLAP